MAGTRPGMAIFAIGGIPIRRSGRIGTGLPLPPHRPIQCGNDGETGTGRERIDDEIFQSGVPSRRPELQDFKKPDHDDGDHCGEQPVSRIGQPECQPDQNERERMLAVLTEIGMRP